jgi:hypothetical protein
MVCDLHVASGQSQRARRLLAKKSKATGKKRTNAVDDEDYDDEPQPKKGKKTAHEEAEVEDDYDSQDEYEDGDAQE